AVRDRTGVTEEELQRFEEAAEAIYLPFDDGLGICAQDDAFLRRKRLDLAEIPRERFPLLLHHHPLFLYRHQVCKQADTVLAHFLFEEGEPEDVIRRTYDYYEPLTTHDSSLSECVFSMMAARTGQPGKALAYYGQSASLDLLNTHGNTGDGIHAANMGGCWMGIAFGFGGLRLREGGVLLRPCLPEGLKGYHFTVAWRGTMMRVRVDKQGVEIRRLHGPDMNIRVYEEERTLGDTLRVPLETQPGSERQPC
ncbi:MAG TPA: glycosyl hydrolase family 65 protein, partial [Candidatus Limnocylindria bacterium]|nr:glycosyl hydrolase family 65 protein [Candidatus Limnocylindria bacterium]